MNGLNNNINAPPAKFAKEPCNAKPTAKPAAPIIATNDVVLTPNCPKAVIIKSILKAQPVKPVSYTHLTLPTKA